MKAAYLSVLAGLALSLAATPVHAAPIAIGVANFSGAETVINYSGQPGGAIDGRTIGTVLHNSNGAELLVVGSPFTQLVLFPAVFGDNPGETLSLTFAAPQTRIGFVFAVEPAFAPNVANAATVELFNAANVSLGSLSFGASIPPGTVFPEGFAGLQSAQPFVRAQVVFASNQAWALDNLRFEAVKIPTVPEPGMLALAGLALGLFRAGRRRTPAQH